MEKITLEAIAARMKAARLMANMDQETAAHELGIAKSTLSNYERAKTDATFQVARKMSDLYDVSLDWLGCLSDSMRD